MKITIFIHLIFLLHTIAYANITVTSAFWGTKDVKDYASSFCNTKTECVYKIAPKFIGAHEGDLKKFTISWICYDDESNEQKITVGHDAENKVIKLDCSRVTIKFPEFIQSQEELDISEANSNRSGSFKNIFLNNSLNQELKEDLGPKCFNFIQSIYKQNKTLYTESINRSIEPLSLINFKSGLQDMTFFHWTRSVGLHNLLLSSNSNRDEAHKIALDKKLYESMFVYLRTRDADQYNLWRRVFYIAEDPESSKFLGDKLIKFYLNPKCRSIGWDKRNWLDSLQELELKYKGFQNACGKGFTRKVSDTHRTVDYNEILFIIAEDSGVDIIDFQTKEWFQVLTPYCFEKTSFN